ncbi:MAG: PilZ domain-containing protein [Betaproteobacteria bacterium]
MRRPCTVLIAAPDLLPALEATSTEEGELLTFADADALRALEVIIEKRPRVVALERQFAATPRGTALVNRIKADPSLKRSQIRIVSPETDAVEVAPGPSEDVDAPVPLDQRGTRRAPRFKIPGTVGVMVDGNAATLVDLSSLGAQVVSSTILRPNQRVRIALADDHGSIRFNAAVAWASFEMPSTSGPRYRAGIEFVDANGEAVDAFCTRHRGPHHL